MRVQGINMLDIGGNLLKSIKYNPTRAQGVISLNKSSDAPFKEASGFLIS